jgi:acyl carrier protein
MAVSRDKIKEIIAQQLAVNIEQVTDEAKFKEDLNADSLDLVEMIMAFEEEFNVEIPDDDAQNITTVGDALKYVEEKSASSAE